MKGSQLNNVNKEYIDLIKILKGINKMINPDFLYN